VGGHLTPVLLPCFRRLCAWVSYGYGYTRRSGRVEIFSAGWVRVRVSKSATGTGRVARMVDPHTSTAHHRWQCQIITWRDRAGMKRYRHRTGCRETEKHLKSHWGGPDCSGWAMYRDLWPMSECKIFTSITLVTCNLSRSLLCTAHDSVPFVMNVWMSSFVLLLPPSDLICTVPAGRA